MSFRTGQKVICIETPTPCICGCGSIGKVKKNDIVRIKVIHDDGHLEFFEDDTMSYEPEIFRPLDESYAENILSGILEKVESEELVLI